MIYKISTIMYISASGLFEKDCKYYLSLEICVVCKEFLAFNYVFILFLEKKSE